MRKLTIFIALLLINSNIQGQDIFKKYETNIFSIEYPENWRLDTTGRMNSSFILFSEIKKNDLFNENVNLTVQDLTNQGFTMDSYVDLSENQIKNMVKEGKVIKSFFNKEKNFHTLIWSGNVTGQILKFKQYFFLKNEKVYLLTLTSLPSTYDDYLEVGDKILNSFKLKK